MGVMVEKRYVVWAHWDVDARVWWAKSDDVPGLVAEADSFEGLVREVLDLVPVLLEINNSDTDDIGELPVVFERVERVRLRA